MISEEATEDEIRELEEIVPKSILTEEQFREVENMDWPEAVKHINKTTNCGLKFAKTYFDLYIDKRR